MDKARIADYVMNDDGRPKRRQPAEQERVPDPPLSFLKAPKREHQHEQPNTDQGAAKSRPVIRDYSNEPFVDGSDLFRAHADIGDVGLDENAVHSDCRNDKPGCCERKSQ